MEPNLAEMILEKFHSDLYKLSWSFLGKGK